MSTKKEDQIDTTGGNILFLDISSSCTGYAIGNLDAGKKEGNIVKAGVIWFDDKWTHGQKYNYLQSFILNKCYVEDNIFDIVAESYMINTRKMSGTLIIPEFIGVIKSLCYETTPVLGFEMIYPQTWRSVLKIKRDTNFIGSKSWKIPAKGWVDKTFVGIVPATMKSNITGKDRPTPYDIFDVICICSAWLFKHNAEKINFNGVIA
jgi:hypothetical protein